LIIEYLYFFRKKLKKDALYSLTKKLINDIIINVNQLEIISLNKLEYIKGIA